MLPSKARNVSHPDGSASAVHVGRLKIVFFLTFGVMVAEVIAGVVSNSLALLADAGHMLTDVAGIGLALLAIYFAARPATEGRTYGWYRLEILAAVVNAMLLFAVGIWVLVEAWRRFAEPPEVRSGLMLAVAVVGLLANAISARLLMEGQRQSLNMRGAYLEVLGDLLGSAAVIIAAVVIALTGYAAADSIASVVIGLLILPRTWHLLREAVDVLLEATPKDVDLDEVRRHILETADVADVHDLHAWTITSGMNVVSAHVVMKEGADPASILDRLGSCLSGDFDIEHSTFQLEPSDRRTIEETAHR
jgi:cobalt-zinc-cadmium efflux system protein